MRDSSAVNPWGINRTGVRMVNAQVVRHARMIGASPADHDH
jgi:hypothetical protein